MLTIYHIEGRRSDRVIWLCEELGLPYALKFKRGDLDGSTALIQEVSPLMPVAPTLADGELVLVESAAILEYIINTYGSGKLGRAPGSPDYPRYVQWLHFAEGSAMARIINEFLLQPYKDSPDLNRIAKLQFGSTTRAMAFCEDNLVKHDFFAGATFTAADIMMYFPVVLAERLGGLKLTAYPHVKAWRERIESRPAFKKALALALPDGPPKF